MQQLDQFDIGIAGQEILGFLYSCESRHIALACARWALGVRTARSILEQVAQADKVIAAAAGLAQPSVFSGWNGVRRASVAAMPQRPEGENDRQQRVEALEQAPPRRGAVQRNMDLAGRGDHGLAASHRV